MELLEELNSSIEILRTAYEQQPTPYLNGFISGLSWVRTRILDVDPESAEQPQED